MPPLLLLLLPWFLRCAIARACDEAAGCMGAEAEEAEAERGGAETAAGAATKTGRGGPMTLAARSLLISRM